MNDLCNVGISEDLREILPGLRVHALLFEGARVGYGHRGLDPLRTRVASRVRERVSAVRDPQRLPEVEVFLHLLAALGIRDRDLVPVNLPLLRAVTRREPVPVLNDAVDGASALALYHLLPVLLFDARTLRPPLSLMVASPDMEIPGPHGPGRHAGVPVLADGRGALASIFAPHQRAEVTEATKSFLVLLLDPGLDGGIDHGLLRHRAENWLSTLTGARLVASAVGP